MHPVTEEVAKHVAENLQIDPISVWEISHLVDQRLKALEDDREIEI